MGQIFGILSLALTIYFLICALTGRKYRQRLSQLPDNAFLPKGLLVIGLRTQGILLKLSPGRRALIGGDQVRRKLGMIYGERQLRFYGVIYSANALTYLLLMLWLGLMLAAASGEPLILPYALVLGVAIVYAVLPKSLDRDLERRNQAIRLEFPDFLSKFILLIGANMTVVEAWNAASTSKDMTTPLYRELAITNQEMQQLGSSPERALRNFSIRMRDSDISRFISSVLLYIANGNGDLAEELSQQASEAWSTRKHEALRLGETASSKLTFAMLFIFAAIMILVMAPALITIGQAF